MWLTGHGVRYGHALVGYIEERRQKKVHQVCPKAGPGHASTRTPLADRDFGFEIPQDKWERNK